MDLEFWQERWQQGQIGFHQSDYNPHLIAHWSRLGLNGKGTVFVPLCGKSKDLLWLRDRGHQVIGVEGSSLAIADFIQENGGEWSRQRQGPFISHSTPGITLLEGDFFELDAQVLDGVVAVYDRAAMVAFPPVLRRRYQDHMAQLLPPATQVLLVTMEYDPQAMAGPPFAVMFDEVGSVLGTAFSVEDLGATETLEQNRRFKDRGLGWLRERCILMCKY